MKKAKYQVYDYDLGAEKESSDSRIYLSSDQTYTNKAYKQFFHKKQHFFNASDPSLLVKRADYKNRDLEKLAVGEAGLFCPTGEWTPDNSQCGENPQPHCITDIPEQCCEHPEHPYCFAAVCGKKIVADIAVVLDGSIPKEYNGLINKFLNDIVDNSVSSDNFKEEDYGRKGSRIAVYTAAALMTEPRDDKQFKPWVQGQNQFDNMLREYKDCTEWEHRTCNKVFYEIDGSFNFAQSKSVDHFKKNVDELTKIWGDRSAVVTEPSDNHGETKTGSFESVDMDASINEVIENGFSCSKGARIWPAVPERRLFILTWDYTTLQSKTLELAKLQDLNPQLFFLNPKDTKLINW